MCNMFFFVFFYLFPSTVEKPLGEKTPEKYSEHAGLIKNTKRHQNIIIKNALFVVCLPPTIGFHVLSDHNTFFFLKRKHQENATKKAKISPWSFFLCVYDLITTQCFHLVKTYS